MATHKPFFILLAVVSGLLLLLVWRWSNKALAIHRYVLDTHRHTLDIDGSNGPQAYISKENGNQSSKFTPSKKLNSHRPNDAYAYILEENLNRSPNITYSLTYKDVYSIVEEAKKFPEPPVMISLLNDAFLPFALSWFCNTKDMEVHKQVLLITTDEISKQQINRQWPEVKVILISVDSTLHGSKKFSNAGYIRLCILRTQVLQALLDNNIETFLFEFDSLWLRSPIPLLRSYVGKYDILYGGVSTRPDLINGGLMYLFPSYATKKVFMALNAMLWELNKKLVKLHSENFIPYIHNDQEYMSILAKKHYAGLHYKVLPLSQFADGLWYNQPKEEMQKSRPILICFNWVVGNQNKISRAKKWGHWFIKEISSCDTKQIESILTNFNSR